jgi:hypothetical protein
VRENKRNVASDLLYLRNIMHTQSNTPNNTNSNPTTITEDLLSLHASIAEKVGFQRFNPRAQGISERALFQLASVELATLVSAPLNLWRLFA